VQPRRIEQVSSPTPGSSSSQAITPTLPVRLTRLGTAQSMDLATNPKTVSISSSQRIKGLLQAPIMSTNDSSNNVSSIVSTIVSKAKPQNYVVLPLLNTTGNGKPVRPGKYILMSTSKTARITPITSDKIPGATRIMSGNTGKIKTPFCTAVISVTVDTVSKWLDCNRDMLYKTVQGIAEKLKISKVTKELLTGCAKTESEPITLKWVGIGLMLIIHKLMTITSFNGVPLSAMVWSAWIELKAFFHAFEGCLLLVRKQRVFKGTAIDVDKEDAIFEQVLPKLFKVYSEVGIEMPDNMNSLLAFMSEINTEATNGLITSVLSRDQPAASSSKPGCSK